MITKRILLLVIILLFGFINQTFSSSEQQYKTLINSEDIYQVTYDDFLNFGVNVNDINLSAFRISSMNKAIPVNIYTQTPNVFSRGDYIEFYGCFLHGKTGYYDPYVFDNAYFLSWNGTSPSPRMKTIDKNDFGTDQSKPVNVSMYQDFIHLEETHHHRDFEFASEEISDHWTWTPLIAPVIYDIQIPLNNIVTGSDRFASIKISLIGFSHLPVEPDHHVMVFLNGKGIGDFTFDGQSEYVYENAHIPMNYISNGLNKVQLCLPMDLPISDDDTIEPMDIVSLNWVEFKYWRELSANFSNRFKFSVGDATQKLHGLYQFKITDFASPNLKRKMADMNFIFRIL